MQARTASFYPRGGNQGFTLLDAAHWYVCDETGPAVSQHFGGFRIHRRLDDALA